MGNIIFGLILAGFGAYVAYDVRSEGITTGRAAVLASIFGERFAKGLYAGFGYLLIAAGLGACVVGALEEMGLLT